MRIWGGVFPSSSSSFLASIYEDFFNAKNPGCYRGLCGSVSREGEGTMMAQPVSLKAEEIVKSRRDMVLGCTAWSQLTCSIFSDQIRNSQPFPFEALMLFTPLSSFKLPIYPPQIIIISVAISLSTFQSSWRDTSVTMVTKATHMT